MGGKHWLSSASKPAAHRKHKPDNTGCNSEMIMSANRSEKGSFITFSSRALTVPELMHTNFSLDAMEWNV